MKSLAASVVPITLAITELQAGGAEKNLAELALRLDPTRFAVEVVSLQDEGPIGRHLADKGVRVHSLGMKSVWDAGVGRRRLGSILESRRPGVLVSFLFHANMLCRHLSRRMRIPHVSGVRVAEEGARWHLWVDWWTARPGDRYVAVAPHVERLVRRWLPRGEIVTIPNGIDLRAISEPSKETRNVAGIDPQDRVLLWMGRLTEQKNVAEAVEGVRELRAEFAQAGAKLVIVGEGPERGWLERERVRWSLEDVISVVGRQDDAWWWHGRSEGLFLTSRWEGMPNVVLEAMAQSRPVICRAYDGAEELVEPRETGWLYRGPEERREALLAWLTNPSVGQEMGRRGRQRVEKDFTIEKTVARWEAYLDAVVRSST